MRTPIPNIQGWPLGGVDAAGRLTWSRNDESIRESMLNILLTRPGERLQRPDFGGGLLDFIHQPNNETTRNLIASAVRKALQLWEPRAIVEAVDVEPSPTSVADVHINIHYHMAYAQIPVQFGFTFNLGQSV